MVVLNLPFSLNISSSKKDILSLDSLSNEKDILRRLVLKNGVNDLAIWIKIIYQRIQYVINETELNLDYYSIAPIKTKICQHNYRFSVIPCKL